MGGEAVKIAEGTYTLKLMLEPEPIELKLTIKADQELTFILVKQDDKWIIKE